MEACVSACSNVSCIPKMITTTQNQAYNSNWQHKSLNTLVMSQLKYTSNVLLWKVEEVELRLLLVRCLQDVEEALGHLGGGGTAQGRRVPWGMEEGVGEMGHSHKPPTQHTRVVRKRMHKDIDHFIQQSADLHCPPSCSLLPSGSALAQLGQGHFERQCAVGSSCPYSACSQLR